MTQRMTEAERERERADDERNAGCFLESLGCGAEGCLFGALWASCLVPLIWFLG